MIGDWVHSKFSDKPVRLIEIKVCEYGWVRTTNVEGWKSDYSLIGIPLTPEILEKNGFKEYKPNDFCLFKPIFFNPKEYRDSDDCVRVFFTSKGFCFRSGSNLSIALKNGTAINRIPCYVHQLQHALRLCGIEKEILV